jgi:hypothetical protein
MYVLLRVFCSGFQGAATPHHLSSALQAWTGRSRLQVVLFSQVCDVNNHHRHVPGCLLVVNCVELHLLYVCSSSPGAADVDPGVSVMEGQVCFFAYFRPNGSKSIMFC